jgi:hypothetical protein
MTVLPGIIREPVIIATKHSPISSSQLFVDSNCTPPASPENNKHQTADSTQLSTLAKDPQKLFPFLILNDKKRSTGYRSSDPDAKFPIRTSPLATSVIYKWPTLNRYESEFSNNKPQFQSRSNSNFQKLLNRVPHPSRPDSMYKMETSWETSEAHYKNEQRVLEMKRNQNIRENTAWSIGPYADTKEREYFK